jgi:acetylornithine deacetylase/succinyl-diaminopimelate desuccinylase-like protein
MRDEMIDFTSELVSIASENPPGSGYAECVRVIRARLRALNRIIDCASIYARVAATVLCT